MAINFPTDLDDFENYVDGTTIMEAATLNDMQFAIETLQAKVGIDGSVVPTSHDYKLVQLEGGLSVCKAWAAVAANGTKSASYNVASTAKDSTGIYTVTWDTDFSSVNYAVTITITSEVASQTPSSWIENRAAGSCKVHLSNSGGTYADFDFSIMAFGLQ